MKNNNVYIIDILRNIRIRKLELERMKRKVAELGDSLGYKSPSYEEKVQSSLISNSVEEEHYKFLALKQEYQKKILALELEVIQIEKAIDTLDSAKQSIVLKMYYIDGYKLFQIADLLGYDYAYLRRVKNQGINNLTKKFSQKK